MRILLVEDDESILEVLTAILAEQNYIVDVATDGEAGWELVEAFPYDLVLLDLMLPKLDGISFCRRLREQNNPVLVMMLTVRDTTTDKLLGLDSGADDYVVKPFNVPELVARIRALLRRGNTATSPVLECGDLRLNPNTRAVTYAGQALQFSRREYLLLELFLRNPHRVFSRSAIVEQIWSFNEDAPNEDTVKSHIKNIRRELKTVGASDLIETLYGQGYRINPTYLTTTRSIKAPTPTQQQLLNVTVAQIWERTKGTNIQRLVVLEQAVQALKSASLSEDLGQNAIQSAHKLAGSLGTFGLETGSRIAAQIEEIFQAEIGFLSAIDPYHQTRLANQVEPLVTLLRQELEGQRDSQLETVGLQSPPASVDHTQPRLLIVDGDAELTEAIATEAAVWNVQAIAVSTLEAAQAHIRQTRPDLILFGLSPTSAAGQAFLAELSREVPPIPFVLFSSQDRSTDRVAAAKLGGKLFLPKTISASQVLQSIAKLLQELNWGVAKILVVDPDPQTFRILRSLLEPQNIQLTALDDPTQFWETLKSVHPDLLIIDIHLPTINGLELCQSVRQDFQWNWLPILVLTADSTPEMRRQAFTVGVDDYITKPIIPEEISTRLFNRLRQIRLLRSQAETDILTDLANQQQSTQILNQLLQLAHRSQQPICLAVLDLDHFRQINDQYGHIQGDRVLRQFGQFLRQKFRTGDVVARWGGEEFVVGMYGVSRADGVERLAEILEEWRSIALTSANGDPFQLTFSAGVAQYPADGVNLQMLYRAADAALYQAKVAGRDRVLSAQWKPLSSSAEVDVVLIYPKDEFAQTLLRALDTRGYHTCWLSSGKAAVNQLRGKNPALNAQVILLSDTLPDLDGLDLLRQLNSKRLNQTRVILLLNQADTVEQVQAQTVFDYLLMPCTISILMQRLRQAMGSLGISR